MKNFETARGRKEWGLARLALDKCLQAIEGEGGEIPADWRIWRVELELARGNWENANMAAKCVFVGDVITSPYHVLVRVLSVMLYGPIPTRQTFLRCVALCYSSVES